MDKRIANKLIKNGYSIGQVNQIMYIPEKFLDSVLEIGPKENIEVYEKIRLFLTKNELIDADKMELLSHIIKNPDLITEIDIEKASIENFAAIAWCFDNAFSSKQIFNTNFTGRNLLNVVKAESYGINIEEFNWMKYASCIDDCLIEQLIKIKSQGADIEQLKNIPGSIISDVLEYMSQGGKYFKQFEDERLQPWMMTLLKQLPLDIEFPEYILNLSSYNEHILDYADSGIAGQPLIYYINKKCDHMLLEHIEKFNCTDTSFIEEIIDIEQNINNTNMRQNCFNLIRWGLPTDVIKLFLNSKVSNKELIADICSIVRVSASDLVSIFTHLIENNFSCEQLFEIKNAMQSRQFDFCLKIDPKMTPKVIGKASLLVNKVPLNIIEDLLKDIDFFNDFPELLEKCAYLKMSNLPFDNLTPEEIDKMYKKKMESDYLALFRLASFTSNDITINNMPCHFNSSLMSAVLKYSAKSEEFPLSDAMKYLKDQNMVSNILNSRNPNLEK